MSSQGTADHAAYFDYIKSYIEDERLTKQQRARWILNFTARYLAELERSGKTIG